MKRIFAFLTARLWTAFTTLAVIAGLMMLWVVTPSTILFRPIEWTYDPATGVATFTRVVISDEPMLVRWSHIIYVPGERPCADGDMRPYDPNTQIEVIPVRENLRRCLDNPRNVAVLSWQPLLWGLIPLRPYTMTVPSGAEIPHAPAPRD